MQPQKSKRRRVSESPFSEQTQLDPAAWASTPPPQTPFEPAEHAEHASAKRVKMSSSNRKTASPSRKAKKCFMCEQPIIGAYLKCKHCTSTVCTVGCEKMLEGDAQHEGCKKDEDEQEFEDFELFEID